MEPHGRRELDIEISTIEHDVLNMATRAEVMVGAACESLVRLDTALAREVMAKDDEIDTLDLELEHRCLRLMVLQQPTGNDFRLVGTVLKVITDIERVADLAVDIARITLKIDNEFGEPKIIDLPRIANVARSMFRMAIEAFVKRDESMVAEIVKKDDEVDALYRELRGQIHDNMRANPRLVVSDSWMLLAIHHVERIADHAVNVAERVSFMISGRFRDRSYL